jgi:hypothetical protein
MNEREDKVSIYLKKMGFKRINFVLHKDDSNPKCENYDYSYNGMVFYVKVVDEFGDEVFQYQLPKHTLEDTQESYEVKLMSVIKSNLRELKINNILND